MSKFQNGEGIAIQEIDIESRDNSNTNEDDKSDSLLYGVDDVPPLPTCIILALQQCFLTIGSVASYPVILMPLLCYDDSQNVKEYRSIISSNCVLITGISTLLQSTFGSRIPTVQATSISYFVAAISVFNSVKWRCPVELTNMSMILPSNGSIPTDFPLAILNGSEIKTMKAYVEYDGTYHNNEEVWMSRMRMMQGSILVCGLAQAILGASGLIGNIAKYIGPMTVAPVLTMVTYALCDIILSLCQVHWGIAGTTLITFYLTSVVLEKTTVPIPQCAVRHKRFKVSFGRFPLFSMFPVLFSVVVGWLVYFATLDSKKSDATTTISSQINLVPWAQIQYPFRYGAPIFAAEGILGIMVAIIPATLEAIGQFAVTSIICHIPNAPTHAVNRGILFQGMSSMLYATFGVASGATFWTSNTAIISITRVGSRRIFQYTGLFLVIASLFPKSISIFALMPKPVVGGLLFGIIGTIFSVGISSLQRANMCKNRNLFVLGFSTIAGIIIPKYFNTNPESITQHLGAAGETVLILLRSPMLISGVLAFTFDNISPGTRQDRGLVEHNTTTLENAGQAEKCEVYNLPFKTDCFLAKWLPFCPSYTPRSWGIYRRARNILYGICRKKSTRANT